MGFFFSNKKVYIYFLFSTVIFFRQGLLKYVVSLLNIHILIVLLIKKICNAFYVHLGILEKLYSILPYFYMKLKTKQSVVILCVGKENRPFKLPKNPSGQVDTLAARLVLLRLEA